MKRRSKLGFDIIGWSDSAVQWCIDNKPTAVEFMLTQQPSPSNIEMIRRLAEASPETIPVIRAYPDDLQGDGNAVAGFEARMLQWTGPFRQHFERVVAHSVNEPVVFSPDAAKRLADYEHRFINICKEAGLIPMCFCLSESHLTKGNQWLWSYMDSVVRVLYDIGGLLGFNEYDWPRWNESRDEGYKWRLGNWENNLTTIRQLTNKVPAVGIGEGILDGKIMHPNPHGWRKEMGAGEYLGQIKAIYDDTYYKDEVAFHLLFSWSPGHHDWASYDVSIMADLLASYLRENPPLYWKGGTGVGVWDNVPSQIKQWKELIGKCTREYHVPIPDYNGIPVSPAKVVACIIRIESNGDPGALGGDGKAHGLMQVWKPHYPDVDLLDPETNIRTGLAILKAKLDRASGDLESALYYYSGGIAWSSEALFEEKYWWPFVEHYKTFWGIDLEPEPEPDPNQEILEGIARIKSKAEGARYLLEQIEEEAATIEEKLIGGDV